MKKMIRTAIPYSFRRVIWELKSLTFDSYGQRSYSQEGEDMILRRIFEHQQTGFYVDIGAHHPKRFSNTYYFYKCGWRGINIDAMPGSMNLFKLYRPRDINIEAAISDQPEELTYFIFNETALNTLNPELAKQRDHQKYRLVQENVIKTRTLASVLDDCSKNQDIDIMSIDVEGLDLNVLQSNNWEVYKPRCILVEQAEFSLDSTSNSAIYNFLRGRNYALFAKTLNTLIFLDEQYERIRV